MSMCPVVGVHGGTGVVTMFLHTVTMKFAPLIAHNAPAGLWSDRLSLILFRVFFGAGGRCAGSRFPAAAAPRETLLASPTPKTGREPRGCLLYRNLRCAIVSDCLSTQYLTLRPNTALTMPLRLPFSSM